MKKRVLIVDNDVDFLNELGEILGQSGYEMVSVDESEKAFDIAQKSKIDIILLDLKMPGKSGFELAYEISCFSKLSEIPIIAMTGFYKEGYEPLFTTCGIRKCLKKPFRPLEVISEIEAALP